MANLTITGTYDCQGLTERVLEGGTSDNALLRESWSDMRPTEMPSRRCEASPVWRVRARRRAARAVEHGPGTISRPI